MVITAIEGTANVRCKVCIPSSAKTLVCGPERIHTSHASPRNLLLHALLGQHYGGDDHRDEGEGHPEPTEVGDLEFFAKHDVAEAEGDDGFGNGHGGQGVFQRARVEGGLLHGGPECRAKDQSVAFPVGDQSDHAVVLVDFHGNVAEECTGDYAEDKGFFAVGSDVCEAFQSGHDNDPDCQGGYPPLKGRVCDSGKRSSEDHQNGHRYGECPGPEGFGFADAAAVVKCGKREGEHEGEHQHWLHHQQRAKAQGDGLQEVPKQGCSCACPPEGSANDGKDRGVCEPGSITGGLFGDAVPHDCPPGDGERGGECEQHSNKIALHFLNRS